MDDNRKNELEELSKTFIDSKKKVISEEIDVLHSVIVKESKAKIPENVFVSNFLEPFKNINTLQSSDLSVKQWILIAGSSYAEVDIIDGKGRVIHTTPPLISRPTILEDKMDNVDFKDISINFINKTNHIITSGVNYLKTELSVVEKNIVGDTDTSIKKWEHITEYYTKKQDNITGIIPTGKLDKKLIPVDTVDDNDLDYS